MARVTGALFSASARGNLKKTIIYSVSKGVQTVKGNRLIQDGLYHFQKKRKKSRTLKQLAVNEYFSNGVSEWNNLTSIEKNAYKILAKGKPITAIAIFIKQYMLQNYDLVKYLTAWMIGSRQHIQTFLFLNKFEKSLLLSRNYDNNI